MTTSTAEVALPNIDPDIVVQPPAPRKRARRRRLVPGSVLWPLLVVVLVGTAAALLPLFYPRYYFIGDTESGAYGQWYAIGTRIAHGDFSPLNPSAWQASLYFADGAWGLYSPVLWLIGWLTHQIGDTLTLMLLVKGATLVVAGLGAYVLARSFGVARSWAALAGVVVPLGGFTIYQDISSWVTGAISWAFLPWAWAGLRAFVHRGRLILLAVVPAALLLGIVYTDASIMLMVVVVAVAVEALVAHRLAAIVRMLVAGVVTAGMVVTAHLPSLLIYPATNRAQTTTESSQGLVATATGMLQTMTPFGSSAVTGIGGAITTHPLTYATWLLPLLPLIRPVRLLRLLRSRLSLPLVVVFLAVAVQMPLVIGPLRWPARLLPYLVLSLTMLLVFGLARARATRPGWIRWLLVAALAVAGAVVDYRVTVHAVAVNTREYREHLSTVPSVVSVATAGQAVLLGSAGVAFSLAVFGFAISRYRGRRPRWRQSVAVLVAAMLSVAFLVPQHEMDPEPGGSAQGLATQLATYRDMLRGAKGDVFIVGSERSDQGAAMSREAAIGNAWYLTGHPVQNEYTTLSSAYYSDLLCMKVNGVSCTDSWRVLRSTDAVTGLTFADLFAVSSVLLIKTQYAEPSGWMRLPAGWHVVRDTALTRLVVRDKPVPGSGSVVWTTPKTTVHVDSVSDTRVRFTVDALGSSPRVAFSRLPWPGYTVSGGARIAADPTSNLLLTVDLPANAAGRSFTLTFTPPGSVLAQRVGLGALGLTALWLLLSAIGLVAPGFRWTGARRLIGTRRRV